MTTKYIPLIFFIGLGIFFIQKATRLNAKRTLAWGRSGGKVNVSRLGYFVWGITFLIIAVTLLQPDNLSFGHIAVLGICLLVIIAIGIRDSWLFNKQSKSNK